MVSQAVSRPQVWCQYPPSEAVEGVVAALEEPRQVVARLQAAASVACPIAVDLRLSGANYVWKVQCITRLGLCPGWGPPRKDQDMLGVVSEVLKESEVMHSMEIHEQPQSAPQTAEQQ